MRTWESERKEAKRTVPFRNFQFLNWGYRKGSNRKIFWCGDFSFRTGSVHPVDRMVYNVLEGKRKTYARFFSCFGQVSDQWPHHPSCLSIYKLCSELLENKMVPIPLPLFLTLVHKCKILRKQILNERYFTFQYVLNNLIAIQLLWININHFFGKWYIYHYFLPPRWWNLLEGRKKKNGKNSGVWISAHGSMAPWIRR